ncbi:hypothetical protein BKH43_06090 [Helicobacter sp. 13S00401-1]|uniref:DUF4299 family protein n=1 Tax=Helicobacter sp. 13S00401-1 TaxID=1905758 RepID=UPI000BA53CE6|nr:DUF4299 family protein [Helicobacter sp. 13S00401-1]PAF50060.1 hypothetical protein BKH43_06090 [Helicobacter sp. 13S00401-1]
MSFTFTIQNKKSMKENSMTLEDVLLLVDDIQAFNLEVQDDEDEDDEEDRLFEPLSNFEFLLVGREGESARGFEVSFEKELRAYVVRFMSPCSLKDWELGLEFIKQLAIECDSRVKDAQGNIYLASNIDYDYKENIESGIKAMAEQAKNHTCTIYGIHHPMSFNKAMFEDLLSSIDMAEAFSTLITNHQNIDAYFAKQQFFSIKRSEEDEDRLKEDDEILGVYTLTQSLPTILPYTPKVEYEESLFVEQDNISKWEIGLVVCNGDEDDYESYETLEYLPYPTFIEKLPKEKYHFIDASYILVKAMSRSDLEDLLTK